MISSGGLPGGPRHMNANTSTSAHSRSGWGKPGGCGSPTSLSSSSVGATQTERNTFSTQSSWVSLPCTKRARHCSVSSATGSVDRGLKDLGALVVIPNTKNRLASCTCVALFLARRCRPLAKEDLQVESLFPLSMQE
eukprot:6471158-Amphidinium_carterae.1